MNNPRYRLRLDGLFLAMIVIGVIGLAFEFWLKQAIKNEEIALDLGVRLVWLALAFQSTAVWFFNILIALLFVRVVEKD